MNKILLHLFAALSLALTALPGLASAAPDGGDYVALQVPDLRQAVTFFHDVMNCNSLTGDSSLSNDGVALLDCGRQTVVELTQTPATAIQRHALTHESVRLTTNDATDVTAWLRANRIERVGKPVRVTTGADQGKIEVGFLTPWGQPIELVSRISADNLLLDGVAPEAAIAAP